MAGSIFFRCQTDGSQWTGNSRIEAAHVSMILKSARTSRIPRFRLADQKAIELALGCLNDVFVAVCGGAQRLPRGRIKQDLKASLMRQTFPTQKLGCVFFSAAALLLLTFRTPAVQAETACNYNLKVGSAAFSIDADDSMVLSGGIGPRYAEGQEGELRAVAVVIQGPNANKVALVSCDVLFTPADIVDAALTEIEMSTGIPASHVLVNATHTHHAPSTSRVHGCERETVFCDRLRNAIVKSVQHANTAASTNASQFLFHLSEETTVGANSRLLLEDGRIHWIGPRSQAARPTGPFDPQFPVLAFRGKSGKYQAIIYNHSTHTIGTRNGNVRSPSFYGLAAQELEQQLGTRVCFLEGASGSTHNIQGVPTAVAVDRMKTVILDALKLATPQTVNRIRSQKRRFEYKVRIFDESTEDKKVVSYVRKYLPSLADDTIRVFREMRRELKPHQTQTRATTLQTIVIGDVAIIGIPAEYFTGLGLEIKQRSPFKHTYIAELANDWIGYLPDREAHRLGGYQTWMGLHSYAEIGTGEQMANAVIQMLQELSP